MNARARFDDAPCGLLLLDGAGIITEANRTIAEWLAIDAAELTGAPIASVLTPASLLYYETRWRQTLGLQRELREVSLSLQRRDGSELPALVNARLDRQGRTYAAVFDATGRLDYERGLLTARREAIAASERVRTLQEASEAFSRIETEEELVAELSARARQTFAAARSVVVLTGEDGLLRAVGGEHPLGEEWLRGYRSPAVGTVVIERLDDMPLDPVLVEGFRAARIEAVTSTPIEHAGEQLGRLLCFYGRPRRRDEEALDQQRALGRLGAAVLVRLRLQRRLERMALHDELTGLPNRSYVMREIAAALADDELALAVIFIDLDGFKGVNDRFGHAMGDAVLRATAMRIRDAVRDGDMVGRLGGDEFIVLARDVDAAAGEAIALRILEALDAAAGDVPGVTASLGLADLPAGPRSEAADRLVNRADEAMYRAKAAGKDRIVRLGRDDTAL